MLKDFLAFNANAFSNLIYILTSNLWTIVFLIAAIGTIVLRLKETVDDSIRDEQNII